MGIFSKLKNVLFEEEEIEVPEEEPEKTKPEEKNLAPKEEIRQKVKIEEETSIPQVSDKELFKAEKTFDFPIFDEEEFDLMKDPIPEEPKKTTSGINLFDYERPKKTPEKPSTPEIRGRIYDSKSREKTPTKFRPSPVISPVYGVLDKNYKKEDIVVVKEETKKIDVDDVRKKAFGTLEDDLEKSISETPKRKMEPKRIIEEKKEEKSIDDLLEESSFTSVPVEKKTEVHEEKPVSLEVLDSKQKKEEKKRIEDGETLENDLFDLIDSMYEDKEEEE